MGRPKKKISLFKKQYPSYSDGYNKACDEWEAYLHDYCIIEKEKVDTFIHAFKNRTPKFD